MLPPISELRGITEIPNQWRPAAASGIAFVGDAAMVLDPIWGTGCGIAFLSTDWLVDHTAPAFGAGKNMLGTLDRGLESYRKVHRSRTRWHYAHIASFSKMRDYSTFERLVFSAATDFTLYSYNFCWAVRTLRASRGWPLAASDPRDGSGLGRSRVVTQGVVDLRCRSVNFRHDQILNDVDRASSITFTAEELHMVSQQASSYYDVRVDDLVTKLVNHPLYRRIGDENGLRRFMQSHVFCVWDFQSLLKSLQRHLTCVEVPWLPTEDPESRRLINEIVLDEESDLTPDGSYLSHFEIYLKAMEQCRADMRPILHLLSSIREGMEIDEALALANLPPGVADFNSTTLRIARSGEVHRIAAAFAYGREDVIPAMFQELVRGLTARDGGRWSVFLLYLNLHIEHDGDRHGPMSRDLVRRLCGRDDRLWAEAEETARACIEARLKLWDGIIAGL